MLLRFKVILFKLVLENGVDRKQKIQFVNASIFLLSNAAQFEYSFPEGCN